MLMVRGTAVAIQTVRDAVVVGEFASLLVAMRRMTRKSEIRFSRAVLRRSDGPVFYKYCV